MGTIDKLKKFFNPETEEDYDDGYDYERGDDGEYGYEDANAAQGANGGFNQQMNSQGAGVGLNSGALELKVVKPEKYDSATAQKIADHLLSRRTVVLNLELTNKESARRLIDFLSGVAYSIDGYIQRVANNTFVVVPKNVDVSGEQLQEVKKQEEADLF